MIAGIFEQALINLYIYLLIPTTVKVIAQVYIKVH